MNKLNINKVHLSITKIVKMGKSAYKFASLVYTFLQHMKQTQATKFSLSWLLFSSTLSLSLPDLT